MLSAILEQQHPGKVLATLGNFNNDIGMPLTLLRIRKEDDFAVIEMGANHFDEIDFLTNIAKPNIAVINNAGPAHLEGFGDIKGVSRAKGEIFNSLDESGIAVINADDDYADYWIGLNTERQVIKFGMTNTEADIKGDYLGNGQLTIKAKENEVSVQLNLLGKHNAMNALAATAVAIALHIDLQTIKKGLESLDSVPGRLAKVDGVNGSTLLDDTYNANPGSANAAVDVLAEAKDKRILVLGDMGELGDDTDSLHADIGTKAKQSGIEQMFCMGKYSASACKKFGSENHAFSELDDLVNAIKKEINSDMTSSLTILVKGSRSAQMERVVEALRETKAGETIAKAGKQETSQC
jgi:UDP-N-acetylmuramoyl-tripeptide--D-alanyl-D-alanine ligase